MSELSPEPADKRITAKVLILMKALNRMNGASVLELSRETGIKRQTIYRILDLYVEFGYVRRLGTDDRYYLTHLVRELSDGYREEEWVTEVASPIIEKWMGVIVWPVDLVTFLNNAMHLRETTRRFSPFTVDPYTVGERLPMLAGATGRCYLAFCPEVERVAILEQLRKSDDPQDRISHNNSYVSTLIETTRAQGYAVRYRESFMPRTSSIAVPIMRDDRVFACLAITFITSAATPDEIVERHLRDLQEAARKIERGVARLKSRPRTNPGLSGQSGRVH